MFKIHNQVHEKYPEYLALIGAKKHVKSKYFQLVAGRTSKNDWDLGKLSLDYDGNKEGYLDIEKSKKVIEKYRFILFSKSFADGPMCRFDSIGGAHTNANPKIPLNERKIETPHFHIYDKDGYNFAYQTVNLVAQILSILKNIKVGWQLMCDEYSIFTEDGLIPEILEVNEFFPRAKTQFDVHADVLFVP